MKVEKRITLYMSQSDLLKFVARNLRNEREINVDSIQFNMKLDEHGITRVDEIRFDGTETIDESENA